MNSLKEIYRLESILVNKITDVLEKYEYKLMSKSLRGRVHTVDYKKKIKDGVFIFFIRIQPDLENFDIYFEAYYPKIVRRLKKINGFYDKHKYTFTGRMNDYLDPLNRKDWFHNTTNLSVENLPHSEQEIEKIVNKIEKKYVKVIEKEIIPRIDTLEKLNVLLNDYRTVYDENENKPKMYTLSGGLIFQSLSALVLNSFFQNENKEKLIKMYSWLLSAYRNKEGVDYVMLNNTLEALANTHQSKPQ